MAENEISGLGGRRPLTKEQIARRTVTREEVAMWTAETKRDDTVYMQYWETKEQVKISETGDEHLIFAGRWEGYTAKVWNVLDPLVPHTAYIIRTEPGVKYALNDRDGVMLRFQFKDSVRIYNDKGLTALIQGREIMVFQKGDDAIIKIDSDIIQAGNMQGKTPPKRIAKSPGKH